MRNNGNKSLVKQEEGQPIGKKINNNNYVLFLGKSENGWQPQHPRKRGSVSVLHDVVLYLFPLLLKRWFLFINKMFS